MNLLKMKFQSLVFYLRTMILFVCVWYLISLWVGNRLLLPSPPEVSRAIWGLFFSQGFLLDILVSLRRLAVGYLLAAAIGIPLGFLLGMSRWLESVVSPVVEILRPISPIAWIPIAMFLFGVGDGLAIYIIFYGASFQFLLNTLAGVKSIPLNLVEASLTMGASRWRIIRDVILPGALPLIIVAARLAMASAWMSIIAAELVGAPNGLGFKIEWARSMFLSDNVVAGMATIGILGYLSDISIRAIGRWVLPWKKTSYGLGL
jgi:ABC-type nitrate/sulfonate/bicarbonate transport system permease component